MPKYFDPFEIQERLDPYESRKRAIAPTSFDDNIESFDLLDLDQAIFDLFDKAINMHIDQNGTSEKVPVIYATGERWALVRDGRGIRDKNGTLVLPLVTVRRTDMDRSPASSLPAGGPALKSINYKIKRSPKNSYYQNAKNDIGIRNQGNVGKNFGTDDDSDVQTGAKQGKTSRRSDARAFSGTVFRGKELANKYNPLRSTSRIRSQPTLPPFPQPKLPQTGGTSGNGRSRLSDGLVPAVSMVRLRRSLHHGPRLQHHRLYRGPGWGPRLRQQNPEPF